MVYSGQLGESIPVRIRQDRAWEETYEEKMERASEDMGRGGGGSEEPMSAWGEEPVRVWGWGGKEPVRTWGWGGED